MAEALLLAGLDPLQIGRVIATLNDSVTRRLLLLAEQEKGTPPCGYAWIVFGSEGRMEQVLLTDQDNGLVLENDLEQESPYFDHFSRFVVDSLLQAGFPACRGDVMATRLRFSQKSWIQRMASWIEKPDLEAGFDAAIMLDMRKVGGNLELKELEKIIVFAGQDSMFMRRLAMGAIRTEPPLTFFKRIRGESGQIDVKSAAIGPIVAIAKICSLEAGSRGHSTVARLEQAMSAGTIPPDAAESLIEAFRFALRLRLCTQLEAIKTGSPPSNRISLGGLSVVERRHLKEALVEIRNLQHWIAARYNLAPR